MRWFALFALLFAGPALAGVDVNTATAEELETLSGIGPATAAKIIEYRTANGPFKTIDELDNVSGIGPATLEKIRADATVGKGEEAGLAAKSSGEGTAPKGVGSSTPASAPAAATSDAGSCTVINVNTADAAALDTLNGVGPSTAAAILESRTTEGPFATCDDLDRVKGIGPATLEKIRPCCTTK